MKYFLLVTVISLASYAQLNSIVLIKGQIVRFDKKQIVVKRIDGAQALVPRSSIAPLFKLESGSQIQNIPILTSFFSKIETTPTTILRLPAKEKQIDASLTLKRLQESVVLLRK